MKTNKISGWKAADFSRRTVSRFNRGNLCLPLSPQRYVIHDNFYFQFLQLSGKIPIRHHNLASNFKAAIITKHAGMFSLKKVLQSKFSLFHHSVAGSTLVLNIANCPFDLLRRLDEDKKSFVLFSNGNDLIVRTVKNLPSDWNNGLLKHTEVDLSFGNGFKIRAYFFKVYIPNWQQTSSLITNIKGLTTDQISNISHILPDQFISF